MKMGKRFPSAWFRIVTTELRLFSACGGILNRTFYGRINIRWTRWSYAQGSPSLLRSYEGTVTTRATAPSYCRCRGFHPANGGGL